MNRPILKIRKPGTHILPILFTLSVVLTAGSMNISHGFAYIGDDQAGPEQTAQVSKPPAILELKVGAPVERELKAGEMHAYTVNLATGQYLYVIQKQKGIEGEVRLFEPDG